MLMANLGLIVGRVYSPGGGFMATNVRVMMSALVGNDGTAIGYNAGSSRRYIEDTTNDKGLFAIRFVWSGADIGSAMLYATATLSAYNETKAGQTISTVRPKNVRLALFRDFATVMNTAGSSFNGVTDTMDFAVDLWAAVRKVNIYPVWKTVQLWSSESWALAGGLEMELGK
jgi:hypothetical protein